MEFIQTKSSGKGVAHYSAGVVHNGILYISGQLSINPHTGTVPEGGVKEETKQALANLKAVLDEAGAKPNQVLQCRVYTPDVELWGDINEVYAEFFQEHKPARCVVPTTKLHFGCLVEIEALVALD